MRYAVYVVENLILTHVFIVIIRVLFHRIIFNNGVTYTVLSVISSFLIVAIENSFAAAKKEEKNN